MYLLVLQRLVIYFILDIIYFPVWWYSAGARRIFLSIWEFFREANITLASGLWLRYIFVPMFGQNDWQGRIMSFFIRLVNVIVRSIFLLLWFAVCMFLFSLWLAFPIFVIFMMLKKR